MTRYSGSNARVRAYRTEGSSSTTKIVSIETADSLSQTRWFMAADATGLRIAVQNSGDHEQDEENDAGPGENVDRGSARGRAFNGLDGLHIVVRNFSFVDLVTLRALYDETFVRHLAQPAAELLLAVQTNLHHRSRGNRQDPFFESRLRGCC